MDEDLARGLSRLTVRAENAASPMTASFGRQAPAMQMPRRVAMQENARKRAQVVERQKHQQTDEAV
jgi:hypothetical protein